MAKKGEKQIRGVAKLEIIVRLRRPMKGKDRKMLYGLARGWSYTFPHGRDATEEDVPGMIDRIKMALEREDQGVVVG